MCVGFCGLAIDVEHVEGLGGFAGEGPSAMPDLSDGVCVLGLRQRLGNGVEFDVVLWEPSLETFRRFDHDRAYGLGFVGLSRGLVCHSQLFQYRGFSGLEGGSALGPGEAFARFGDVIEGALDRLMGELFRHHEVLVDPAGARVWCGDL